MAGNGGTGVGGSSSKGGATSGGVGGAVELGDTLLIDDFEDGDALPLVPGGWYGFTDKDSGGLSTLTFTGAAATEVVMGGPGFQSQKSLEISSTFDKGTYAYDPFVGFGVSIGTDASPYDLGSYSGISYTYQGSAHRVQVLVSDVTDYDDFGVSLPASATWKTVTLPFVTFSQEGWGKKVTLNLSHVKNLGFMVKGTTGGTAKLDIDNLAVARTNVAAPPDLTINELSPPADATIDSITIDNPLQARALRYLNRGYNLTNWLEEARFTDFRYDEGTVQKLAAAGFRSLRLPIDLDQYVASTSGSGASLEITVHDDLWTVLDSFDAWTEAHGLSFTIDYHQYNTLPDKADPDAMVTAALLWSKVAEHFADNPREDLFFELMNEPELSFGGVDPTQAEWGAIAEQLVTAIRAYDTTHSIIFGDVNWYGIDKLVARKPLSDDNVIYSFHDYEPFLFTHQGASWASLGAAHDLPYPYDPARWSEYYAGLGFHSGMEAWMLTALKNYYREGNRSALRNHIVSAKRWAVTNNVPVICNEFGAYDATSQLQDRVRYYTDLIGIFEELEIPWQHWFMVMDENGSVIPEYREAMRLGK